MNEAERRQLTISSTPRLGPDEVASRAFSASFRGVSENEVRSFLKRVAEELSATRERERELLAAVDALEEQLRRPQPLDENRMLDVLGEETTRLLRSAREAAEDIRSKAEERAAEVLKGAQEDSRRMRDEAGEVLAVRTREAEEVREELMGAADRQAADARAEIERHSEEQRTRIDRETEAAVEAARAQGREMLDEARSLRERVLADLGRRRALLQGQIEELRSGRDRLLDAYRVVKRTFLEATEALAQVEARAAFERSPHPAMGPDELALVESVTPGATGATGAEADETGADETGADEPGTGTSASREAGGDGEVAGEERHGRALADVDSLFARLRHEQAVVEPEPEAGAGEELEVADGVEGTAATLAGAGSENEEAPGAKTAGSGSGEPTLPVVETPEVTGEQDARSDRIAARDAAIDPMKGALSKKAKRVAQDEQNTLLDTVRRQKGRPTAGAVLAGRAEQVSAWSAVIGAGLCDAYAAGGAAVGADPAVVPSQEVVDALVEMVIVPLRERVAAAVDDVSDVGADTASLVVERIGARYREWKTQELSTLIEDALASSYARGIYDATPEGSMMEWVPARPGRCPDCDDNALEPTARGAAFPTGQLFPPAHPGCRCVLMPTGASSDAEEPE